MLAAEGEGGDERAELTTKRAPASAQRLQGRHGKRDVKQTQKILYSMPPSLCLEIAEIAKSQHAAHGLRCANGVVFLNVRAMTGAAAGHLSGPVRPPSGARQYQVLPLRPQRKPRWLQCSRSGRRPRPCSGRGGCRGGCSAGLRWPRQRLRTEPPARLAAVEAGLRGAAAARVGAPHAAVADAPAPRRLQAARAGRRAAPRQRVQAAPGPGAARRPPARRSCRWAPCLSRGLSRSKKNWDRGAAAQCQKSKVKKAQGCIH